MTELLNLSTWPTGLRVIIRKERPHPGAQPRITDVDAHRITALATTPAETISNHGIAAAPGVTTPA